MKLEITIEHNSGESVVHTASVPEWQKWEIKFGRTIQDAHNNLGVNDILFLAWNAMKREAGGKTVKPFEIWCETVTDFSIGDDLPKDTQPEA
jgi:hypothetical protein